ncbi:UDP-glucosyl transferase 89B1 [Tasmannia lanceolata]|uniref:UDP-glucosyl transferase 89B1 n=1 Tax=Tasmannia lanceolata TaxID=3420 RepID=UPI00406498E6
MKPNGSHILVFPYPAQGHMIPLLDLSHLLALQGLSITILVTPKNLPLLQPLLSTCPSIQTLVLPFPNYPSIPPGVENAKDMPGNSFSSMMHALGELYNPLHQWFEAHPSPPIAILSDFFLGWTHHLALQLGIPRVVFSPSGALMLCLIHRLWRDKPKRDADSDDPNFPISFPEIPNSPIYPWYQISSVFRSYKEGDPVSEFIKEGMRANVASWGTVVNTFGELEGMYVDHMKKVMGHPRVWAVGPLVPVGPSDRGGSSSIESDELLSWLDESKEGSVVYVCFGSLAVLNNRQMDALAEGLERSGARFLWCVKGATVGHVEGEYGVVPAGFEERVEGRGLVIKGWAPQVMILSHRSVGAFLTHCGWNSVLEAILAGVPMLTWPMGADQFVDARLLIEDMGVGVSVCEGADTVPDSAELARIVANSVGGSESMRIRARELKEAALSAVKEGGSSWKDLGGLVEELGALEAK